MIQLYLYFVTDQLCTGMQISFIINYYYMYCIHCCIWIVYVPSPVLPTVPDMCWVCKDGQLVPRLLSLPSIPKACSEIMSCGCTKGCLSRLCSCRKVPFPKFWSLQMSQTWRWMSERSTWWHMGWVTPSGFTQNGNVMQ